MYCIHCGKLISDDSKFCQHCGVNQNVYISGNMGNLQIKEKGKSVIKDKDEHKDAPTSSKTDESTSRFYDIESSDEGNNSIKQLIEFVIAAIRITGIIVISFFALVLSLRYMHNFFLGCVSSLVVGFLTYFLFRTRNSSKESKNESPPLYYIGLTIITFFLLFLFLKFGEGLILSNINNPKQIQIDKQMKDEKEMSMEEQYKSEIKIAQTKLPIVLDEYISWTNIRRKTNGMLECDYLIDDAHSDLYQIDLSAYKVEFANKLKLISYKKYLELCMYAGHGLNCHLISKWDRTKSVDITFVNAEIGEILE